MDLFIYVVSLTSSLLPPATTARWSHNQPIFELEDRNHENDEAWN